MKNVNVKWRQHFRKDVALQIVVFVVFCIVYFPVIIKLVNAWSISEEYSHGFLILPLSLYIIWKNKETLKTIKNEPSWIGLIIILLSFMMYIAANHAKIITVSSVSMVLSIIGYVIFVYGYKKFRELMFPLFFLFFMVPVPAQIFAQITIPLQLIVSKISVFIASCLNIPILREGNIIHLPEKTLQVVQACSGLRSLISLVTLGTIWGYITLKSNMLRVVLILSGIPTAVIINIIRVFLMIVAFHYFSIDLTVGATHTYFGLIIFLLALIIMFFVQGVLSWWERTDLKEY